MKRNRSIVLSYLQLRKLIGFLGVLLPFVCVAGSFRFAHIEMQNSISMYYYSNMRDVFVGILICVSLFLITYQGYETVDNIVTNVTGVMGAGIALFPCGNPAFHDPVGIFMLPNSTTNWFHLSSAATFFILLAINSIWLFTKSDKPVRKHSRKYYRNIVYCVCGIVILACMAALVPVMIFCSADFMNRTYIILALEIIMLFAFGASWLVKGGSLLKDERP
jgi:cytochrome bd-type quinol oxidase subunit 2